MARANPRKSLEDIAKEVAKPKPDVPVAGGETEEKPVEKAVEKEEVVAPVVAVDPEEYLAQFIPAEHQPISNLQIIKAEDGTVLKLVYNAAGTLDRHIVYASGLVQNAHNFQYI